MRSRGSTIKLVVNENKKSIAEVIGIILGDGNICRYVKGKKVATYQVKIAGDINKDREYHINYVKPLLESVFNLSAKEQLVPRHNERFLYLSSKELVEYLSTHGLLPGDKMKNKPTIPQWVMENDECLRACLRGLIDTDGSVYRMSRRDPFLVRVGFTCFNPVLIADTVLAFRKLGFKVSMRKNGKAIYISKKEDVERYMREIGFSNPKHLNRIKQFKTVALSSSGQSLVGITRTTRDLSLWS